MVAVNRHISEDLLNHHINPGEIFGTVKAANFEIGTSSDQSREWWWRIGTPLKMRPGRHNGVTLHTSVMPTWGVSREWLQRAHFVEGEEVISFLHLVLFGSAVLL